MRNVTIIGAGPGNPDLLSRAALDAINIADVVIGAHRALVGIDVPPDVVRCELVKTADIVAALTDAVSWQRAVVVMTGECGAVQRRAPTWWRRLSGRRAGGRARHSRHKAQRRISPRASRVHGRIGAS